MRLNDRQNDMIRFGLIGCLFIRYGPVRVFTALITLFVSCAIAYHAGVLGTILAWIAITVVGLAILMAAVTACIVAVVCIIFAHISYECERDRKQGTL